MSRLQQAWVVVVLIATASCAHFPAWLGHKEERQPQSAIPERPEQALSGSDFVKRVAALPPAARERLALHELRQGNLPNFLRKLSPVPLQLSSADGSLHTATIWVMPDYLAIGNDDDFVRIPLTPGTAQRVADHYGYLLPTKKLVDVIYRTAALRLKPEPLPASAQMASVAYFERHHTLIEAALAALPGGQSKQGQSGGFWGPSFFGADEGESLRGQLIAGHKKDIVLTNKLQTQRNRVAIYGWHRAVTAPIQPLSLVHGSSYADYSHGVRLVHGMLLLDGQWRAVAEVLQDADLAALLSDEGRLQATRYATDCGKF